VISHSGRAVTESGTDVEAPNGQRWDYHVVHLDRIAIALVVDAQDRALMLWRYRFATEQWGYELLGGLVDAGERAATTAAREAAEESGWRPVGEPEHLVTFQPLPGQVTAQTDVYLWREAEQIGEPTDSEEAGRVEWVPLSRVTELAQRQEVLGRGDAGRAVVLPGLTCCRRRSRHRWAGLAHGTVAVTGRT
jgi:8-oxo-dGTP pyrophosphatase MutT (NUDIX family)